MREILAGLIHEIDVRLGDQIAMGDLNGDRVEDGAVVLISNPGTSGTYYDLAVVVNLRGYGFNVASEALGEGIQVKAVAIVSEVIKVEMVVHGPHDPHCCPTLPVTKTYRLQGPELVLVNQLTSPDFSRQRPCRESKSNTIYRTG
jgi:hypothetical protein